jgi:sugar phosphate isomerase/epimerase
MKIGLLGLVWSDWTDVDFRRIRFAAELGFHGVGAHLTVPASTITDELAAHVRAMYDTNAMPFLQVWGPYPSIVTSDEAARRRGVEGARDLARLAAKMGVRESGVRPTSMSPRGDWWPHPDNYKPDTEDRLVRSLVEILDTAEQLDVTIVLETHVTTTLRSAEAIRRVIERTGSQRLKVNLDPCNFVGDLPTAFDPAPMINEMFDVLSPYISTVHLKDFYLEERFVVHISEAVIGTGLMDWATLLRRVNQWNPDGYVVIEHLPFHMIAQARQNLGTLIKDLGYTIG